MTITTIRESGCTAASCPSFTKQNQQIEYVTGDWAGSLSVAWDLVEVGGPRR